jgi:hypothetical protein
MLERAGHGLKVLPGIGAVAAAGLPEESGRAAAAGDDRKDGGETVVR